MRTPGYEIVGAWHAAVDAGDADRATALVDRKVEVAGPRGSGHGREAVRDWLGRAGISHVAEDDRLEIDDLGNPDDGISLVTARFGFQDRPDVPTACPSRAIAASRSTSTRPPTASSASRST